MKKLFLSVASLLLLLGSCTQNEVEEIALSKKQNVVVATIEGQKTRLSVDYNVTENLFNLRWSTGDAFKVFGDNSVEYTWSQGDEFIPTTTPEDPTYAVYPFSENLTINENVVSMELSASPSVANINLPMWADASNGNAFSFKHLAAALQFTLNEIPEGYNQLIVEASNPISGEFTATLDDETPILASTSTAAADKKVTVSFEAATSGTKNQVFYIPLPVGTYTYLAVSVSDGDEIKALKSWENLTIARGKMYYTTATVDVASADAVNKALANVTTTPTTVNLTEEITVGIEDPAIDIPDEAVDVTLNFEAAPVTGVTTPLVINQNEEAASGTATSELNITMPAAAEGLYATINAPTTTVTLEGGTYESLVATTATNTLIIGEGVTIKKLVVKGGNVVLKGNVESIESDEATTITLDKNITLKNACTIISGDITLDLNGYSIKPIYKGYGTSNDAMFTINAGAKLTVQDSSDAKTGVIDTDDGAISQWADAHCVSAIKLAGTENYTSGPVSSFILNSGKVMGTAYGIVGNGSRGGTDVVINGGVVDSYHWGAAIFNPQKGNVTITGGEVISTVGVEMRSGMLKVTGGKITARVEDALTINGAVSSGASFANGVVIGVSQHTTNNPLSIEISGGTFNVENNGYANFDASTYYALYEEDYQDENSGNITLSITGGTFTGKIKSENCEGFVKGGTFSDASVFDFLADNANVTLGANITLSSVVNIKKTVTINLNGKDIIHPASSGDAYGDVFDVLTGGNLTIMGEGRVISENGYSVYAGGDAKVLLEKGKYYSPVSAVYAQKAAVVTIVGGEYYADVDPTTNTPEHSAEYGHNFTINLRDKKNNYVGDTSEIIIKGGKFYKFDPANNAAEGVGTNFVAPGYSSVADGDYYEVKEGIYNETALNAAIVNGAEITLDDDMTIAKAITIPTGVTAIINLNGNNITAPDTDVFEVVGTLTINDESNEGIVSAGTNHPASSVCAVWANGGTVTINGGHYKATYDATGKRNDCIYAGYNADNNDTAGEITINGGKFEYIWPDTKNEGLDYDGDMFLLNCADKDLYQTLITVNGGQFKNNAPSYEPTTPANRADSEVRLGDGKKVYNGETVVEAAHSGTTDIWYVLK